MGLSYPARFPLTKGHSCASLRTQTPWEGATRLPCPAIAVPPPFRDSLRTRPDPLASAKPDHTPGNRVDLVDLARPSEYDHCFNAELFRRAKVYVQAEELRYAVAPPEVHEVVYETEMAGLGAPRWMTVFDRIVPIDGDREILPGISSVLLPGHSPGLMGVRVETAQGPYVLASDAVPLFANWEGMPEHGMRHIIPGVHYDVRVCLSSYQKLDALGGFVLPSHDPRIFKRTVYP